MKSQWIWIIFLPIFCLVYSIPLPQNAGLEKKVDTSIFDPTDNDSVLYSNDHQTVRGKIKNVNGTDVFVYEGSYYLLHSNGLWQLVTYVADENGYVVKKFELKIPMYETINPKTVESFLGG